MKYIIETVSNPNPAVISIPIFGNVLELVNADEDDNGICKINNISSTVVEKIIFRGESVTIQHGEGDFARIPSFLLGESLFIFFKKNTKNSININFSFGSFIFYITEFENVKFQAQKTIELNQAASRVIAISTSDQSDIDFEIENNLGILLSRLPARLAASSLKLSWGRCLFPLETPAKGNFIKASIFSRSEGITQDFHLVIIMKR